MKAATILAGIVAGLLTGWGAKISLHGLAVALFSSVPEPVSQVEPLAALAVGVWVALRGFPTIAALPLKRDDWWR